MNADQRLPAVEGLRNRPTKPEPVAWRVRTGDLEWTYTENVGMVRELIERGWEAEILVSGGKIGIGAVLAEK